MIRVAINGCGRIGRIAFREMITSKDFDIIAINDLSSPEELAHLIKYDTVHGKFHVNEISYDNENIVISNVKKIRVFSEKDPSNLPWKELNIDLVLECTGLFTKYEDSLKHIEAGAKKVLISAPGKGDMKTIVNGVNTDTLDGTEQIVSASSCTTNCLAPLLKVIVDNYTVKKGFMITVHSLTNDQVTLDIAHKKGIMSRRGRSAFHNIIPTSTGAASSIGKVIPVLNGKMDGISYRVPTVDGSLVDVTLELEENVTVEEINKLFKNNESDFIKTTTSPIVSSDVIGEEVGSLVDLNLTNVINTESGQLLKLVSWYDNEWGYTSQMLKVAKCMFK